MSHESWLSQRLTTFTVTSRFAAKKKKILLRLRFGSQRFGLAANRVAWSLEMVRKLVKLVNCGGLNGCCSRDGGSAEINIRCQNVPLHLRTAAHLGIGQLLTIPGRSLRSSPVARSNTRGQRSTHWRPARPSPWAKRALRTGDTRVTIYHVQMAFRRGLSGRWVPILKRYFLIAFTMPSSVIHRDIFHCQPSAVFIVPLCHISVTPTACYCAIFHRHQSYFFL